MHALFALAIAIGACVTPTTERPVAGGAGGVEPSCPPRALAVATSAPSGARQLLQTAHTAPVDTLAFSPSGRYLASFAENLRIWDTVHRYELRVFDVKGARSIYWDGDERLLVHEFGEKPPYVLDVETGVVAARVAQDLESIFPFRDGHGPARWAGVPRGWRGASPGGNDVTVYDANGGELGKARDFHPEWADDLEPIVASSDGFDIVARTLHADEVHFFLRDASGKRSHVALPISEHLRSSIGRNLGKRGLSLASSQPLATAMFASQRIGKFDMSQQEPAVVRPAGEMELLGLPEAEFLEVAAVSLDGRVVAASSDDVIGIWDSANASPKFTVTLDRELWTHEKGGLIALDGAGKQVAIATSTGRILMYDVENRRTRGELGARVDAPMDLLVHGDVTWTWSAGHVSAWSLDSMKLLGDYPVGDRALHFDAGRDGAPWLLQMAKSSACNTGGLAAELVSFDLARARPAIEPLCVAHGRYFHTHVLGGMLIAARGTADVPEIVAIDVATGGETALQRSETLAFSHLEDGLKTRMLSMAPAEERLTKVLRNLDGFTVLAVSPDARWMAGALRQELREDPEVGIWDLKTGARIGEIKTDVDSPHALFGADGRLVLYGGSYVERYTLSVDGKVTKSGARQSVEPAYIRSAAFADGDTLLLGGSADGLIVVGPNGVRVGKSDRGGAESVRYDGVHRRAIATSQDGFVRVWDLGEPRVLATLARFEDEEWAILTPAGRFVGTPEVGDHVGWVFPSPLEHFGFERFASVSRDAAAVRRALQGGSDDAPIAVVRPPTISDARVEAKGANARVTAHVSSSSGVDVVRVYVEGRPEGVRAVCAGSGDVSFDVPLVKGVNRVTLVAFDDRGFASNPAALDVTYAGDATTSDLWVVAVGIGNYGHLLDRSTLPSAQRAERLASLQLAATGADARSVADAFAALAGPGKTYAKAHVRLLVDAEGAVRPSDIEHALTELASMKPDDVAVVLFAGHGFKPNEQADMVFVTSGAVLTPTEAGLTTESLRDDAIGWTQMGEALGHARGRVLLLLDACHAGHVVQEVSVPNDALAKALAASGRAGALVFAAAKGRQVSLEPASSRSLVFERLIPPSDASADAHGFFTGALLQALADPTTDRNGDGALQVSEVVDDVTRRVMLRSGGLQTPWVARRGSFGDFTIAPAKK